MSRKADLIQILAFERAATIADLFQSRMDAMIDLRRPLAVPPTCLPVADRRVVHAAVRASRSRGLDA
ncbi:hypothetical protein [Burkholderia ubonensis]|uniref:hypothetical protein n=1 Tax=Burkholderia ubonensis TaxID=101571 RepID=UPI000B12DD25|nr:hypothetical protein [Burkholderia ubonensis]